MPTLTPSRITRTRSGSAYGEPLKSCLYTQWQDYRENKLLHEHSIYKEIIPFQFGDELILNERNNENFFIPKNISLNDFNLNETTGLLKFKSPFSSSYEINNIGFASYYKGSRDTALIILPHWNSTRSKYTKLCKFLQLLGYSSLCMTLPYHEERNVENSPISNYFLSSNVSRTIESVRQAVGDAKALIEWLRNNNYKKIILLGISIGSPVAMITAANDNNVNGAMLCLTASDFSDVVWTGQSTTHIRTAFENNITLDELKKYWAVLSPKNYVEKQKTKIKFIK